MILGIDPGTKCGWAVRYPNGSYFSGVQDLPVKDNQQGVRWVMLRQMMNTLFDAHAITLVAYELVKQRQFGHAAVIYGGCISIIMAECEVRKIPYIGANVAMVKKFATGSGNGDKDDMVAAAMKKWDDFEPRTPDEADARWIAEYAHALPR